MNSIKTNIDFNAIAEIRKLDSDEGVFLKEIVELYLSQLPILLNEIHDSFYKNELPKVSKTSHNLKGASLNLGAIALANICKKIEINIAENNIEDINNLIIQLGNISKITANELEEIKRNATKK